MTQSVVIGGLGSATFEQAASSLFTAYSIFERTFDEGQLGGFDALNLKDGDRGTEIMISNRFLTPRKDTPKGIGAKPGTDIDPRGILRRLIETGEYFHGEDNIINYYSCSIGEDGECR